MSEQESMKSFDVPKTESVSPEQADQSLKKLYADAAGNKNHPHVSHSHPQHKDFREAVTKLHAIKVGGEMHDPLSDTMSEGVKQQEQKQGKLVAEAEKEMNKLENLGFQRDIVPGDIQPFQVRGLKFQRLAAEHRFDDVAGMLEPELTKLSAPAHIRSIFDAFKQAPDVETKEDLSTQVGQWVYAENEKRRASHKRHSTSRHPARILHQSETVTVGK